MQVAVIWAGNNSDCHVFTIDRFYYTLIHLHVLLIVGKSVLCCNKEVVEARCSAQYKVLTGPHCNNYGSSKYAVGRKPAIGVAKLLIFVKWWTWDIHLSKWAPVDHKWLTAKISNTNNTESAIVHSNGFSPWGLPTWPTLPSCLWHSWPRGHLTESCSSY